MNNYKLLCTFSNQKKLDTTLDLIEEHFNNLDKIFIPQTEQHQIF